MRYAQPRAEYDAYIHAAYLRAESAPNGNMLTPAGRSAGLDPYRFFVSHGGPRLSVDKWGSDELRAWFGSDGVAALGATGGYVLTFTEYLEQTLGGAAERAYWQEHGAA